MMQLEKYKRREKRNVSERTIKSRMSGLRKFEEFLDGREPTPELVEEWIDKLMIKLDNEEMKASTIRQYYKSVRYYFETIEGSAEELDHIKNFLPEDDTDPGAFLEEDEWEKLLQYTKNIRTRSILEIMYGYARRPGEVRLMNEEDVDFDEGLVTFNILKKGSSGNRDISTQLLELFDDGKKKEEFEVYRTTFQVKEDAFNSLKKYLKFKDDKKQKVVLDEEEYTVHPLFLTTHGRVSYSTIRTNIKQAAEKAGIEKNVIPKSMRHSRATHLDWAGYAPGQIARNQLVHAPDSDAIGRYIHARDEDKVRDVLEIEDA